MNNEDLRVKKTKQLIKQAFFDLLAEKPFDKITIRDISDKAMINRGTFYLHYKDKSDLLDNIEDQVIDDLRVFADLITPGSLAESRREGRPLPHLIPMLTYIQKDPSFYVMISNSGTSASFYEKAGRVFYRKLKSVTDIPGTDHLDAYKTDIAVAVSSSILGRWGRENMKTPKDEIAMLITNIIWSVLTLQSAVYKPKKIK